MDVKEAIKLAKDYIAEIYIDEGVLNIGLEEIEFRAPIWEVTIGFSRRWDIMSPSPFAAALGQADNQQPWRRTYKVVEIDDETKRILGVRNRLGLA